ncbi:hypothetical protein QP116_04575 [Pseudoglutamicibacter cumminsii]|uniref:Uncharacterized protein n=1 Tax=Pseudoglutamicibacter cumminsii TaxID=156979 RepID=A0AAP4C7K1_9MICC|nr:hypothetical protein [Pseudoglutamicibacter cumminsii]MDK6275017.1 hypothetical protein [Pseudoglutamicibacter cumminsii]
MSTVVACAGASSGVSDATTLSLGDAVGSSPCVGPVEGVRSSLGAAGLGCVGPGFVGLGFVGFGVLGSEVDGSDVDGSDVVGAGSAGAVPEGAFSLGDGFAGGVTVGVGPNEAAGELELRSERSDARSLEPSTETSESAPTAVVAAAATAACDTSAA